MFDKWKRAADEEADLDLIPVMNLFMVLIPFLLLGAAFLHMGVIPTSTPTRKKKAVKKKKKKKDEKIKSVMAQLVVTPDELRLSFSATGLDDDKLKHLSANWPISKGDYPLEELQQKLKKAKQEYVESNTVTVVPHKNFEYQELVKILDVTREMKVGTKKNGDPKFKPLFPVTVFSKFPPPADQKDKEGGEGGGDE